MGCGVKAEDEDVDRSRHLVTTWARSQVAGGNGNDTETYF